MRFKGIEVPAGIGSSQRFFQRLTFKVLDSTFDQRKKNRLPLLNIEPAFFQHTDGDVDQCDEMSARCYGSGVVERLFVCGYCERASTKRSNDNLSEIHRIKIAFNTKEGPF